MPLAPTTKNGATRRFALPGLAGRIPLIVIRKSAGRTKRDRGRQKTGLVLTHNHAASRRLRRGGLSW